MWIAKAKKRGCPKCSEDLSQEKSIEVCFADDDGRSLGERHLKLHPESLIVQDSSGLLETGKGSGFYCVSCGSDIEHHFNYDEE
ncbi:MAG: hypothetical protein EOP06_05270 [Proteobacteria bacterium]|nr:MAG: hypothetical protein EOP06_05270 [Pseudomonadota bacterium]